MKHTTDGYWFKSCTAWLLVAAAPIAGAQAPSPAPTTPAPASAAAPPSAGAQDAAQNSYLFGLTFGEQLRRVGVGDRLAVDEVARGFKDGLQGKKSTPADQQQLQEFVHSTMEAAIARNQAAAKDFLARNGHEKGVVTTASGLQYKVLVPGNRKAATVEPTDEVTVQYRGKFLDGAEFDSSYARGVPATFTVNGVIKGWQEALVLMKPGAKWELFVPPELAYGATPRPEIPGGSLLIFDVELTSVKSSAATSAPAGTPAPSSTKPPKSK